MATLRGGRKAGRKVLVTQDDGSRLGAAQVASLVENLGLTTAAHHRVRVEAEHEVLLPPEVKPGKAEDLTVVASAVEATALAGRKQVTTH